MLGLEEHTGASDLSESSECGDPHEVLASVVVDGPGDELSNLHQDIRPLVTCVSHVSTDIGDGLGVDRRCTDRFDVPSAFLLDIVELLSALTYECTRIGQFDGDDTGVEVEIEGGFLLILRKSCADHLLNGVGVLHHGGWIGTYVHSLLESGSEKLGDVGVLGELVEILRIYHERGAFEFHGCDVQTGRYYPTDLLADVSDTVVSSHNINLMKLNMGEKGV